MAVNKNFVVRNGIEVAEDLIVASTSLDSVGLGTTTPSTTVDVAGGIIADNILSRAYGITTSLGEFNVGTGGTVISAIPDLTAIGLHTASPDYAVQIDKPTSDPTVVYVKAGDIVVNDGNLKVSGVGSIGYVDAGAIDATGISITGVSTIASIDAQGIHVGVATIINADVTGADIGIATITNLINTGADIGIASITNLIGVGASFTGITTTDTLSVDQNATISGMLTVTGVSTFSSDVSIEGNLNVTGDIVYDEVSGRNIIITGISTLDGVKIGDPSGIVTASSASGIVTYYGDGSNLTGVATGLTGTIGISSGGTVIGTGITVVDFTATNATITVAAPPDTAAGIATVNIQPSVSLGLVLALGS